MTRRPIAVLRHPRRARRSRLTGRRVLVAGLVLLVLGAVAGGLSRIRLDTTIASFLPGGDQTVRTLGAEQTSFGADPIAVVLTACKPAALLSRAPLRAEIALESRLAALPDVAVVYGPGTTLNEITRSLQNVLIDISGTRDALMSRAAQAARAAGQPAAAQQAAAQAAVAQFDVRYAALLQRGLKIGLPSINNTNLGPTVFLGDNGQGQPAFRWLVPDATHESVLVRPVPGLSQARTEALVTRIRAAVHGAGLPITRSVVTGTPVIVAAFGTEITHELPVLAGISLAVVAAGFLVVRRRRPVWERLAPLGVGLTATAMTMAAFGWLGASLSLGLLAFLPIILGVGTDYPIYALRRGRPRAILATAAASAVSLAVLAANPLPYVRDLGLALAAGLLLSAVLGVGVARLLGPPAQPGTAEDPAGPEGGGRATLPGSATQRAWLAAGALGVLVAVVGWAGLPGLGLNSDPERLASGLPALQQGIDAQSVLGASGELDVYVRGADVLSPTFLAWYETAQDRLILAHGDQLRPIVSPATLLSWLGNAPTAAQIGSATDLLPAYLTSASIRPDRRQAVMAFGVQLGSLGSESRLISSIRALLPPLPAGATVSVTGLPAVGARSYDLLSGDRLLPNVAGIAAFGLVLGVALRRRRSAVLAVVAAVLAAGWGFALLRVTGTPLTPLTVSLGSLTSAVGGEFTVMALSGGRAGRRSTWSAVIGAGATSVSGFAVLVFSDLEILRQFGIVLAGSVALALLAAWVVVSLDGAGDVRLCHRRRDEAATGQTGGPGMTNGSQRSAWDQVAVALGGDGQRRRGSSVPAGWDKLRDALTGSGPSHADQSPAVAPPGSQDPGVPAGWAQLRSALAVPAPTASTSVLERPVPAEDDPVAPAAEDAGGAGHDAPIPPEPTTAKGGRGRRGGPLAVPGRVWATRSGKGAVAAAVAVAVAAGVVVATSGGGGLPSNAAFRVNGTTVSTTEFSSELTVRQTLYGIQAPATTDTKKYATYLTSAAQAEAVSVLLDQLAPRQGVAVSAQTAQANLSQAVSQQYGGDQTKFAQALGAAGLNQDQVLTEITHNLVYQRLFAKIVGTPTIGNAQVQQYFAQHTAQLAVPETRQISHIVVANQASAQQIVGQLAGGAAFATLAASQSLDAATKASGGQLGNYSKADLQSGFATAAFTAAPNVPFGPVQDSSGGWDIGVVTAVHPAHAATLDATTTAAIKQLLLDQAEAAKWDAWLGGQIRSARVTYAAKYRPANPNQPPQIPIPQLTGETLAGVGPAQAATTPGSTTPGSTTPGSTAPASSGAGSTAPASSGG